MADFMNLDFDLTIHRAEDRSGDEPRLQICFVGHNEDGAVVEVVDTGRLANDFPARRAFAAGTRTLSGRSVGVPVLPSPEFPFLGIAVRALEEDNSRSSDRRRDLRLLEQRLEEGLDPIFDRGAVPDVNEVWQFANSAPVHDNFGDDDDKIGVSARVYPDMGRTFRDSRSGDQLIDEETLRFVEDDEQWQMDFSLRGFNLI